MGYPCPENLGVAPQKKGHGGCSPKSHFFVVSSLQSFFCSLQRQRTMPKSSLQSSERPSCIHNVSHLVSAWFCSDYQVCSDFAFSTIPISAMVESWSASARVFFLLCYLMLPQYMLKYHQEENRSAGKAQKHSAVGNDGEYRKNLSLCQSNL